MTISSDIELPTLPLQPKKLREQKARPQPKHCHISQLEQSAHSINWDGRIDLAPDNADRPPVNEPTNGVFHTEIGWLYRAEHQHSAAEIMVHRDGKTITWTRTDDITDKDLSSVLTGAMLSAAATAHEQMVLHGSVVNIHGRVIALLAPSGTGKSTTTFALTKLGATLVSEDAFGVSTQEDHVLVLPGAQAFRLHPNVLNTFGVDASQLPRIHQGSPKRLLPPPNAIVAKDVAEGIPLDAVWFLRRGNQVGHQRLNGASAFIRLQKVMHPSWMYRHPTPDDFDRQTHLLRHIPAYELIVPEGLDLLENSLQRILKQVPL